ncbi:MAG: succinate dehydrogenase, cytochrome b556 subunit [Bradyrhizobium sp.]|uniref:succinate dehydrogenase, cytochrome b556 subunit n=1 Tax=Bradyrhizobium sp. TaxID=376 RepID=UPI001C295C03|nr:succinate dehydrogenase, cytochrome b556 subunit [Bradyrhizobium sp.]MBU6464797.1 succinate dehydrogenase, cytochrome b556 subunit [Pseudomonadota bacterium]MDE2069538.1 succinate dehydrogenase, cytochrome b556 subunit [Bradyrhizobium sp.]MDE2473175.1 succinate dehydrogenase, cytochrome b556 subunit [Bradyrhizobium sp.]
MSSQSDRQRPLSPNIQIYRPQLTSVLSIGNRISGIALGAYAVGLVILLVAVASGPDAYAAVYKFIGSWVGRIVLFGGTFCLFFHFCGGIRHLVWDAGYGFSLRAIYLSGWTVVAASIGLTALTYVVGAILAGYGP